MSDPLAKVVFVARNIPNPDVSDYTLPCDFYGTLTVKIEAQHVIVTTTKKGLTGKMADEIKAFVCKETGIRGRPGVYMTRMGA